MTTTPLPFDDTKPAEQLKPTVTPVKMHMGDQLQVEQTYNTGTGKTTVHKAQVVRKTEPVKNMTALENALTPQEEGYKAIANGYFGKNKVADFSTIPTHVKLSMLQNIPRSFIRHREIKGTKVPYIPHAIAEKMLNFVFNFNFSSEVVKIEKHSGKSASGKQYIEAEVYMRFKFFDIMTGREIIRDIVSGHKGYPNDATTEADTVKSAISKGYSVVARTFGIASNLNEPERKAYENIQKAEVRTTPTNNQPIKKEFEGLALDPNF